jgi:murein DD-endopeptidase MepM/ murein hydrolase activator NlpD
MRLLVLMLATLLLSPTLLLGPAAADTTPTPSRDGVWPLAPRPQVVRGFQPPLTRWGAGHRGVDLLGHAGQQVHTSLGGTVSFAAPLAGRGVVVVDHGGLRTTYEPVSASVSVGQVLARGAVIGTLQRSSSHCFPRACLHWGLLRGDAYLNPLTLVGAGPIRLLPLMGGLPTGGPVATSARGPSRAV